MPKGIPNTKKPRRKKTPAERKACIQKDSSKNGAPSKLTPEVQEAICRSVRKGNFMQVAAMSVGIHHDTLKHWLKKGAQDRSNGLLSRYHDFYLAVHQAEAEGEERDVDRLDQYIDQGTFEALKFKLSLRRRRLSGGWGQEKIEIEHSGQVGMSIDDKREALKNLAKTKEQKAALKEVAKMAAAAKLAAKKGD